MNPKELLSRKIAGIPVLFLVLGVSAIVLYGAIRLKPTAATTPAADNADTPDVSTDTATNTDQPVFQATPTIIQPSGVNTGSVTSTPQADTDTLWSRRAIDYLRQNGYSLDVATSAITKYLNGDTLTSTEASARDKAVQQFGLPPETVPTGGSAPSPTTPTPVKPFSRQGTPPCNHTVKGSSDDTFAELALGYYGLLNGTAALIHSYNPQFAIGQRLPVGTVVKIPKLVAPKYYKANGSHRTVYTIAAVNGTSAAQVAALNPTLHFPVKVGTSVRVR